MPITTIKATIDGNLPSGNQIPISVLVSALKNIVDDYYTELGNKVSTIAGKGLSANDFTTILLTKLNGIADGADVNPLSHEISFINGLQDALSDTTYIDNLVNALIGAAPINLNTLEEIANALNNNPNAYNDLLNAITTAQALQNVLEFGELQVFKNKLNTINLNLIETGDIIMGWMDGVDSGKFLNHGSYISGDPLLLASYNPTSLEYTDYN